MRFWTDLDRFVRISGDFQGFKDFFEILKDLSRIVDFKDLVKIYYNLYEISVSVGPLATQLYIIIHTQNSISLHAGC